MIHVTPSHERVTTNPSVAGPTSSCWFADLELPTTSALHASVTTDVCIVGAGISGLTTAYLLLKAGKRVVVLDQGEIGAGETGRTSAHLASILDDRFMKMRSVHGDDATRLMHQSHAAAIDMIERLSRDEGIHCDFARLDAFLFPGPGQDRSILDEELQAARAVGVEGATYEPQVEGLSGGPALRFPRQARFHPMKYLAGLARAIVKMGGQIHGGTMVIDMHGDGPVIVKTRAGHTVTAQAAVAATNVPSPINNWMGIYTKQAPYRTYMVGLEIGESPIIDALYWDFEDPYHYVRLHRNMVLVGGEDHKTGQYGDVTPAQRLDRLEQWARGRFAPLGPRMWEWSGQVNEPDDGAAFIGRAPTSHHKACYVITGDSGMGLTHGTLGAMLVTDLILGNASPWEAVYAPGRKPTGALAEFMEENLNAAVQYTDYVLPGEASSEDQIPRGSGAVIRHGLAMVATYRASSGEVHRCSAACTHLKGVVRWNPLEQSWDCPCHGSRFGPTGKVLVGPAVDDLPPHTG